MKDYDNIPTMIMPVVQDYLYELGQDWSGEGAVIELGAWLGGASVPLLNGLVEAGFDYPYFALDRWRANESQVNKTIDSSTALTIHQNLLPLYKDAVADVYDEVIYLRGEFSDKLNNLPDVPIEILILDGPKKDPLFTEVIEKTIDKWIPGVTIIGFLDYYFYKAKKPNELDYLVPLLFVKNHEDCFTKIADWPDESYSAFFRYEKKIPLDENGKI